MQYCKVYYHERFLDTLRADLSERGFAIWPGMFSAGVVSGWMNRITGLLLKHPNPPGTLVDVPGGREPAHGDEGGRYLYRLLTSEQVRVFFPSMGVEYVGMIPTLSELLGRPVIASPFEKSAHSLKVHYRDGAHGWHLDTNAFTVLVYLDGTGTIVESNDKQIEICPRPGDVLLMHGRAVRHCSAPCTDTQPIKVVLPWNYYYGDETPSRPDGLDELVFGELPTLNHGHPNNQHAVDVIEPGGLSVPGGP